MRRRKLSSIIGLGLSCFSVSLAGINDGLVAYYPLDGNAMDASTNGAHGSTYTGVVSYAPGKSGQAAWFNGQSCIRLPQQRLLDGASNATVSAWIYLAGGSGQVIGIGDTRSGFDPISSRINTSRVEDLHFTQITETGQTECGLSYGDTLPGMSSGEWHLLTMVLERQTTQSVFRCYIDTTLAKQTTNAAFSRIAYDVDMPALIGAIDAGSPWQFWNGGIDDVRFYDRALSNQEIVYLFNGGDTSLTIEVSQFRICWSPPANKTSQLQYRSDATGNQWVNLGDPIPEAGMQICVTNDVSGPHRFYRVLYMP
jgi:hypothetical protein